MSKEDIKDILKRNISSCNKELISNVIIDNLSTTEVGLEQLYLALLGIEKTSEFAVDDNVLCDFVFLSTWRFDRTLFKENVDIIKGQVKCVVVEIDMTKESSVCVSYQAYKDSSATEKTTFTDWIKPGILKLVQLDFPID
jgi:hypothetical protein